MSLWKLKKTVSIITNKNESIINFTFVLSNKIIINGKSYSLEFDKDYVLIQVFKFFISEAYAEDEIPQVYPILKLIIEDYFNSDRFQDDLSYSRVQCNLHRRELSHYYETGFKSEKELSRDTEKILTNINTESTVNRCSNPKGLEEKVCQSSRSLVLCEDKYQSEKATIKANYKDQRNDKPESEYDSSDGDESPGAMNN